MWHWDGTMGKQLRLPQENGNNAQGQKNLTLQTTTNYSLNKPLLL